MLMVILDLILNLPARVTILLLSSSSPWTCLFQLDVKICTQLTVHTKHVSQNKYVLFCQSLMSKQHISISYLHTSIPCKITCFCNTHSDYLAEVYSICYHWCTIWYNCIKCFQRRCLYTCIYIDHMLN